MSIRAPLIYYFPGTAENPSPAVPAEFADRERSRASGRPHGPDKGRGTMISPGSGIVKFDPDHQDWDQVSDTVWIGVDRELIPEEFATSVKAARYTSLTLGDGRLWRIPTLNPISPRISLPTCDKLLQGEWQRVVRPGYSSLTDHCSAILDSLVANTVGDQISIQTEECRPLIAAALAYFYDLTLLEMSSIGLFAHDIYWDAIAIITDFDAIQAAARAQMEAGEGPNPTDGEPDSSPTKHGEPDTPPTTNPPSSTSTS